VGDGTPCPRAPIIPPSGGPAREWGACAPRGVGPRGIGGIPSMPPLYSSSTDPHAGPGRAGRTRAHPGRSRVPGTGLGAPSGRAGVACADRLSGALGGPCRSPNPRTPPGKNRRLPVPTVINREALTRELSRHPTLRLADNGHRQRSAEGLKNLGSCALRDARVPKNFPGTFDDFWISWQSTDHAPVLVVQWKVMGRS